MKRYILLLIFGMLHLAGCNNHPDFVRNDIRVCSADGRNGYFVPEGIESRGMLYVDNGNLYAEEHPVEVSKWFGRTYLKGEGIDRLRCTLTHYRNPALRDLSDGVDYLTQQYPVGMQQDVEYGKAVGFWTSYPYDYSEEYGRIVVEKLEDLLRNEPEEQTLCLDIYTPEDGGNHLRPLLVMIHEGAFFAGDKADDASRRWCEMFASCGYVAVSVNYRMGFNLLSFSVKEAAYCAMQDVNAAIRYMLSHKVSYKIDPDKIFLAGCSAGAILALNSAFMNDTNVPESMREVAAEMGPLASVPVSPAYNEPYTICAVGNLWGAVLDPEILKSAPTAIISFHSKYDPVVPFGEGIPFADFVKEMLSEMPGGRWAGGYLAKKVMPTVYGSYFVDSLAQEYGRHTELHTSEIRKHTLVRNDSTQQLNVLHTEFFEKMNDFFVDEMVGESVKVLQNASDARIFYIEHPENVKECSWTVQDGFIVESLSPSMVRVLLYGKGPEHLITVKGVYRSGIAFEKSFPIEMM